MFNTDKKPGPRQFNSGILSTEGQGGVFLGEKIPWKMKSKPRRESCGQELKLCICKMSLLPGFTSQVWRGQQLDLQHQDLKKPNIPTTIDTLLQMHTLTPLPFPLFLITPTAQNAPSPSLAIVRIDAFQRRDPCALALCWRAAFDCCDGGGAIPVVFIRTSFMQSATDGWTRTLMQALSLQSPAPQQLALSCAPRGGDGGR